MTRWVVRTDASASLVVRSDMETGRTSEIGTSRRHEKYERLIERTKAIPPIPAAVVHPCDEISLTGALEAAQTAIIVPTLVGPERKIRAAADAARLDIGRFEIVPV